MITILKQLTLAAALGDQFIMNWIRVPEGILDWQVVALVHSRISSTAGGGQLTTSWDMNAENGLGSAVNLATLGLSDQDISTGMGPYVRFTLSAAATSDPVLPVWLTPKEN